MHTHTHMLHMLHITYLARLDLKVARQQACTLDKEVQTSQNMMNRLATKDNSCSGLFFFSLFFFLLYTATVSEPQFVRHIFFAINTLDHL